MYKINNIQNLETVADEKLYHQTSQGNEHAFRILMSRHLDKVWRLSFNILADDKDSEDVVQEVFLSVWKKSTSWQEGGAKFSTWLYRVSINKAIDFKRKKARTPIPLDADKINFIQEETSLKSDFPLPDDILLKKEAAQEISKIILSLPAKQKTVIHLFYFEEMTVPEIAKDINTTEVAVRSLLKRGKKSLREELCHQKKI
ncbi:MAG: hypothetical protein COB54_07040 [Alphaproteobacteria bacterium]|nr:MAG: hypothetical protein COB54_07040 [Alphaproteobacteria bacterium]